MSEDDLKTYVGDIKPVQLQESDGPVAGFTKDEKAPANRRKTGPGRPPGLVNRVTREMQEAILAAAEELGEVDFDKWPEQLKGVPGGGMKQFCKVLAVKELRHPRCSQIGCGLESRPF